MYRREFIDIGSSAAALAFLNAHTLLAPSGHNPMISPQTPHLIETIRLQTTTPPDVMQKFYAVTLGLRGLIEKTGELHIFAGKSQIIFEFPEKNNFRPFYHFAFNIPENKIEKAFQWQRKRTTVVHPNPEYETDQITHFTSWNAHSVFFLDPAGNLLEYIARHDLDNARDGEFSANDILYLSEIGIITGKVKETGQNLMKTLDMTEYRPGSSGFWPIGNELGLLLMIKKGNIWTGNPGEINETDVFKLDVRINKSGRTSWALPMYPYHISG